MRGVRRIGPAVGGLLVALCLVPVAAPGASGVDRVRVPELGSIASRATRVALTTKQQPFPATGFRIKASNGYTLYGVGYPAAALHFPADLVYITARGEHGSATYGVVGTVDEDAISADFGSLGSIDLHFQPSGEVESFRLGCGSKQRYPGEGGTWEGTLEFTGEGGYTTVNATSSAPTWAYGPMSCSSESFGSGIRGVVLEAHGPVPGYFTAAQNKGRGTAVDFDALEFEDPPGMAITREAKSRGGGASLTYPRSLSRATAKPPAPFSGHGTFIRSARPLAGGSWTGNLQASFPGGPTVSLAGPGFRAVFHHGTLTQSR